MSERRFTIFDDDDEEKACKNSKDITVEMLNKQQKHYMKLLRDYSQEIEFIDQLMRDCRAERRKFFGEELPEISRRLSAEHIDERAKAEWLNRLSAAMQASFDASDRLTAAFGIDKAEEFRAKLESKMKGI